MAAGVSDKKTGFWKTNCRTPEARISSRDASTEEVFGVVPALRDLADDWVCAAINASSGIGLAASNQF